MRLAIKIFKALGDETRLRILSILLVRACCVCEVAAALDISQTRASRNLNLLYDAGLLTVEKEGQWSLYSANTSKDSQLVFSLLESISKALRDNSIAIIDRDNLKSIRRVINDDSCCAKKEQPTPVSATSGAD